MVSPESPSTATYFLQPLYNSLNVLQKFYYMKALLALQHDHVHVCFTYQVVYSVGYGT